MTSLTLGSLHGEVHRFTGVIDRLGAFPSGGELIRTVCVRDLHLASTEQPIDPEHWWFRLRQRWMQAGIQPGDRVLFTTKVRRCSKGWDALDPCQGGWSQRRRQVMGLADSVRDVVVSQRAPGESAQVAALRERLRQQQLQATEAWEQVRLLERHRDALLAQLQRLREQKVRPLTAPRAQGQRRGFLSVCRAADPSLRLSS